MGCPEQRDPPSYVAVEEFEQPQVHQHHSLIGFGFMSCQIPQGASILCSCFLEPELNHQQVSESDAAVGELHSLGEWVHAAQYLSKLSFGELELLSPNGDVAPREVDLRGEGWRCHLGQERLGVGDFAVSEVSVCGIEPR